MNYTVVEGGTARAWGPGLCRAQAGSAAHFSVSTVGLVPPARPHVSISGPGHVQPSLSLKRQDLYDVTYIPPQVGMYDVTITANGKHISGKLLNIFILEVMNERKAAI